MTTEKLERIVLQALRERLYSPANMKALIAHVRDALLERAKQETRSPRSTKARAEQLREVEQEIDQIKTAVRTEKATDQLLSMLSRLEDAERRRKAIASGREAPARRVDLQARLERVLAELPDRVQAHLEQIEVLLAQKHIEEGKQILASLGTEILISPDGTAEIRGDLRKVLTLVGGKQRESVVSWLGEEDSNPR